MRISAALLVLLAVGAVPSAQVVYDNPSSWFTGSGCPANWSPTVPAETLPAQPDTYRVRRPTGGPTMTWSRAAVETAWTVNGTFDVSALDAALADGSVISLRAGRLAQVRCAWRPLGGLP